MTSPIRFTVFSSTLLFTLQATADDAARNLDRVQVTGNRIAQSAGDAGHSITILERADIEASRSIDVIDLLGKQTGIDVVRTGGSGSQNSIFIRGGNSNHALILIDGMRVNSATQGLFDFAHLPLALIERIEIVRGPRASVWGSDALSGVIQIFTRAPDSAHAEMRLGSYRRAGLDAGTGISGKHGRVALSAGFDTFDGFSATTPDNVWSYDPDNDGYRNEHAALQTGTRIGSQSLAFTGIATRGDVEFDQGRTQADNHSWNLALSGAVNTTKTRHSRLCQRIRQSPEKSGLVQYADAGQGHGGFRRECLQRIGLFERLEWTGVQGNPRQPWRVRRLERQLRPPIARAGLALG
ncbi:MAG: hypothetical protein RIS14_1449 [Pseudomonadota bacterium]